MVVLEPMIIAYAVRLCGWAASPGHVTGYRGSWNLGLHVSELRYLRGFYAQRAGTDEWRFDEDYHRAVTTASLADLEDRWQPVVGELVGALLHTLKTPQQPVAQFVTF
jgi:hypothetical protein